MAASLPTPAGSVSSNTMEADLPPSSSTSGVWWIAAASATARAATFPPVKVILSTPGWPHRAVPASAPPTTTFSTPAGTPASCATRANARLENGACSGGLSTTALPAATAGATFSARDMIGPFHGTIAATTP